MNTIEKIQAVQNTMEQVCVAGHDNWNRMLGCWQTLEAVKREMIEDASKHEDECAAGEAQAGGVCGA